ncbi:MAG: class I adenylate-forming enzyme family protein [Phenylobacterium sp.]|uniref:class I adenylate-forming enzyme family protein n=1 Tax=Phenylobacterium sp. TaxID=1871053 RepID=UPI002735DDF0|nr:class I adenylate-forming enzyme family protein [Phenylobacterium sp.]MDP3172882.1 class I adenylate-forming enzyme family protein [Phenylobacterium sp.]
MSIQDAPVSLRAAAMHGGDPRALLDSMPPRYSQLVKRWADLTPERPALICDGVTHTYGELWTATLAAIDLLRANGVGGGDRVLFLAENGLQVTPLLLAASELDVWAAPLNARMSQREVSVIRDFADCRTAVYCVGDSAAAVEHAALAGAETIEHPLLGRLAIGPQRPDAQPEPVQPDKALQTAVLVFTSGTTGEPKGVMLSHQALMYMGANMVALRGVRPDDCFYNSSPVSHAIGLGTVLMTAFWAGASAELVARFTPAHLAMALVEDRISSVTAVPTLFLRLLEHAEATGAAITSKRLRSIATAGAPLDLTLKARIEAALGVGMSQSYGLTECNPIARSPGPVDDNEVGAIQPGVEIRLVREDGKDAAADEIGEIWVKGPTRMLGYFRNPTATQAVMRDGGWLNTGDLALMDDHGKLRIIGRSKELIIRSGFNVYPVEVEGVLGLCPGVAAAAVVGRSVEGNEEVVAFVQALPGHALEVSDLTAWSEARLAPYKRPAEIIIVPDMPIGPTGKIMKIRLKERLAGATA